MIRAAAWRGRVGRVLALLEEERALIRGGDLGALAAHAPRSQAALEDFAAGPAPQTAAAEADLLRVREAAQRNQTLLSALLGGIAEARREIARQIEIGRNVGYDRAGTAVARATFPKRDHRA